MGQDSDEVGKIFKTEEQKSQDGDGDGGLERGGWKFVAKRKCG